MQHAWHRRLLVLLVAIIMCCLSAAGAPDLVLLPINPEVEDGGWLTLNCAIQSSYNGNFSNHDIYFTHASFTYRNTTLVGRRTALLRLQWTVEDDKAGGHISCHLPGIQYFIPEAIQHVTVVRRPLQPEVISCWLSNWNSVNCTWRPSSIEQEQHMLTSLPPTHVVQWKLLRENNVDVWHNALCIGDVISSCLWNIASVIDWFRDASECCVQVTARDEQLHYLKHFENTSAEFCFDPTLNVIVDKPRELTAGDLTERRVSVQWLAPVLDTSVVGVGLVYSVTVLSEWNSLPVLNESTTNLSVSFSAVPYTRYSVSVRVKTTESRLWSVSAQHNVTTAPAAPAHSPQTASNAFTVSHIGRYSRTVFLYWQTLPVHEHYGPQLSYIVLMRTPSSMQWTQLKTVRSATQPCTDVTVDVDTEVKLSVIARNSVGRTDPDVIIQLSAVKPAETSGPSGAFVELIVQQSSNLTVIWSWTLQPVYTGSNLTLFWCRSQSPLGGRCTDDIQWLDVAASWSEHIMMLNSSEMYHYSYGAALRPEDSVAEGGHEGIEWAQCLYNASALSLPVHGLRALVPSYASLGEVLVTWQHPPCDLKHGYISSVVLYYCRSQTTRPADCLDEPNHVSVAGHQAAYNLTGLDQGVEYIVWLYSVTSAGRSTNHSEVITIMTSPPIWTPLVIAGVSVGLVVFILLTAAAVWAACKYCRRCHAKLWSPVNINVPSQSAAPAAVSDVHRRYPPSYAPAVEYNRLSYNRQGSRLSSSSHGSGHMIPSPTPLVTPESVSDSVAVPLMDSHGHQVGDAGSSWMRANHHQHSHLAEFIPLDSLILPFTRDPAASDDDDDDDEVMRPFHAQQPDQRNGRCEPVPQSNSDYIKHDWLIL